MREIPIDREKLEEIEIYLLNNNLNCASKTLKKYMCYIESVFNDSEMNQKRINFKNRKCYNHIFDVIQKVIKYDVSDNKIELEKNIIIAILHDIGRGIEIMSKSCSTTANQNLNHTKLGIEYLFNNSCKNKNIYDFLTDDFKDDETINEIKYAIEYHSTYTYPEKLPHSLEERIKSIRFCDKAAIMDQFIDSGINFFEDVLNINKEEFVKQEITDELMMFFINKKCVNRMELSKNNLYTSMAHALCHIALVFDTTNDPRLFVHLKNINWVDVYVQQFPIELMTDKTQNRFNEIVNISKQYINERIMVEK